jgi:hypothetical protein
MDPIDPQLLSKVLRTKLGLSWEPQWDQSKTIPEQGTTDDSVWHPSGYAPIPAATESTMGQARTLADPLQRRALGLPPLAM